MKERHTVFRIFGREWRRLVSASRHGISDDVSALTVAGQNDVSTAVVNIILDQGDERVDSICDRARVDRQHD